MAEIKGDLGPDHIVQSIAALEARVTELEARLDEPPKPPETLPDKHIFVSNKILKWNDLPNTLLHEKDVLEPRYPKQPDNNSLRIISDNNDGTYTYEADFDWDNLISSRQAENVDWLVDVLQFKNNQLKEGAGAFQGMPATELTALPDLDTSNLTSMYHMFGDSNWKPTENRNFNQSVSHFDTSNVTDMGGMFYKCKDFNQSLNNFDTSKVTRMDHMFYMAPNFNQPLDHFETSSVTDMRNMFYQATNFDQDISNWCVENIDSKPGSFDSSSGFAGQTDKQPKWGQPC